MRLRTLSFILLILFAIVPCMVISVILYNQVYHLAENNSHEKLEQVAEHISSDTLHGIEVLSTALELLARQEVMVYGLNQLFYSSQILDAINLFGKKYALIESLYVVANDGQVVESYKGNITAFEQSSLVPAAQQHPFDPQYFNYSAWLSLFNDAALIEGDENSYGIALYLPIYSVKHLDLGPIQGYIIAIIPINYLLKQANKTLTPHDRVNLSFNGRHIGGEVGFHRNDSVITHKRLVISSGSFRNALWFDLNVIQYRDAITAGIYTALSPVLTVGAVIIVVLIFSAILIAHWVSHAFNQLYILIKGFELGHKSTVHKFYTIEFKEMSNLFKRLQTTISTQVTSLENKNHELAKIDSLRKKYLSEIRELNTVLEHKVEQRTAELATTLKKVELNHFILEQLIVFRRSLEASYSNSVVYQVVFQTLNSCMPNVSVTLYLPKQPGHQQIIQSQNMQQPNVDEINNAFHPKQLEGTKALLFKEKRYTLLRFKVDIDKSGWLLIHYDNRETEKDNWLLLFIAELKSYLMMRSLNENLDRLASTDSLTQLKNRKAFDHDLDELETQLDSEVGIYIIDVNGLKEINDKKGHEKGDALIKNTAELLTSCAQEYTDNIYRIGGDEFAIILKNEELKQAPQLSDRLKSRQPSERFNSSRIGLHHGVSFSIGFADTNEGSFSMLYQMADKKMYANKQQYYQRMMDSIG